MIEVQGFTKRFGDLVAVDDLNLKVAEGEVFGFIGPNGAGKSTTIRFLATLLKPTAGDALIAGHSVCREPLKVRAVIGYMPDTFGLYDGMKVWEFLDFFAVAYRIPIERRRKIIADVLELLDLGAKRDDYVNTLSRGMKQRLCLAKTLLHDPPVLILDEPASGLDPRARIEIKELLKELNRMGKTILISSHILSELADICSSIGIIERGVLRAAGSIAQMQQMLQRCRKIEIDVLDDPKYAENIVRSFTSTLSCSRSNHTLRLEFSGDDREVAKLVRRLVEAGVSVKRFAELEVTLEELFMNLTQGLVR